MGSFHRRDFLRSTALGAAAVSASGLAGDALLAAEAGLTARAGANDVLRVAVVGVHGRGMSHVGGFTSKIGCTITHICDADSGVIGRAMTSVEKSTGKTPAYVQDFRKLLDDKSIDVISIATPNHWHSLMAIWAIQAGKDVYVEKPVSHNVSEGRRVVEAARKYNRICQTGTQCRSMPGMREAIEFVRSGGIGKVRVARGLCYKSRPSIGKVKEAQTPPKSCDYDLWCGPAAKAPLMRQRLHYDWHWTWEYGNGDLGNQGIHQMDIARWGLGKNTLSNSVASVGGRFGYVDDGETANTQICVFDYGDSELIFEVRGLSTRPLRGANVGVIFHGTEGSVVIPSYEGGMAYDNEGKQTRRFETPKGTGEGIHFANFVKAVRERKVDVLNADILEGHLSSALCHLGNISYRLGTDQPFNKKAACFGDDKEAAETLERMATHLQDNKVALDGLTYRVGRKLPLDVAKETFIKDTQADTHLTRAPRAPFVVPEKV